MKAWDEANSKLEDRAREEVRSLVAADGTVVVGVVAAQLMAEKPADVFTRTWSEHEAGNVVREIRAAEKDVQSTTGARFVKVLVGGATSEATDIIEAAARKPVKGKGDTMLEALFADGPSMSPPVAAAVLALLGVDAGYRSIDSFLSAELDKAKVGADAKPAKPKGAKKAAKKAGKKVSKKKASKGRAA